MAQILRTTSAIAGSGVYVAIERFTGTPNGRQGSFVIQYNAIVNRGSGFVNVEVIPDTGTGELTLSLDIAPDQVPTSTGTAGRCAIWAAFVPSANDCIG